MLFRSDYFERALELCTQDRSIRLMPVDVGEQFCREVDFPEDLEAVRAHVQKTAAAAATNPAAPAAPGTAVSAATPAAARKPALT